MSVKMRQELFDSYQESVAKLRSIKDFYEYEKEFARLHTEFGRQMLELSIEQTEKERKKKSKPDSEK